MLLRQLIRLTSAIGVILTGIIILILWIIAANDRGNDDAGRYQCRGCNYLFHDALANDKVKFGNSDLNTWVKNNRNPYPILIAFGVILGVFWMVTGAIGFLAGTKFMAWIYLIVGVVTYIMFVVIFPIIVERISFVQSTYCQSLWNASCKIDSDWTVKHSLESYQHFWGAALVGFLLGAYQIASATYLIHENERPVLESQPAIIATKP